MATTSRQTSIFGIEDWRALYKTYNQADFQSYNFETLRKGFVDYLQHHYPEDFNDYVESSEFVALLDVIAFMGQGIAYRQDLNTRENFLDTAERRDSVVKLAQLVGYTPKRNETARGTLKVSSVSTTENVIDFNRNNLSNVTIRFNDGTNIDWQEQFNTIINSILISSQQVGSPGKSNEVLGITTDEYTVNLVANLLPVIPFSSTVNGISMDFEVVSATVNNNTVTELAPRVNGDFNIFFQNDKLGFGSDNTGFFFNFKQGTLTNKDFVLNERIANRSVEINVEGINSTDITLYELDSNGGVSYIWKEVENIYAPIPSQDELTNRKFYSVTNRANDQVTLNFGDGIFSDIPLGSFRAFVRSSNGLSYVINPIDIASINIAVPYVSRTGRTETATFTASLTQHISNASAKEELADIKRNAPAKFYTQNRMVNGEDYNNFPYTSFSSIIKSKAIVRTNVGTSRYLDLVDPTGKYSSINTFNSDGVAFTDAPDSVVTFEFSNKNDIESVIKNIIEPKLSNRNIIQLYYKKFPRRALSAIDIAWNQSTTLTNETTGFFKASSGTALPIGSFATDNKQHIIRNALIKFTPPVAKANEDPYYFDNKNRLKQRAGGVLPTDNLVIWASVKNVTLDGTNFGVGNNNDGTGPVTLSSFIPTNAIPVELIPVFDTDLPISIEQAILEQIEAFNDFGLGYNNISRSWYIILNANLDSAGDFSNDFAENNTNTGIDASWIMKFSATDQVYTATARALKYFFSSIIETRFFFDNHNSIFDPKTGQLVNDFINVLKTNSQPDSNTALISDIKLDIIDQPVESDGFVNDFLVEVSYTDDDNNNIADNPDFFEMIVNDTDLVFLQTVTDADGLERDLPLLSDVVNTTYSTAGTALAHLAEFNEGSLFYFSDEDEKFRKLDTSVTVCGPSEDIYTHSSPCEFVPVSDIKVKTGRQNLQFHYRHNTPESNRINPSVTNIIDIFVVTDAYYNAYTSYIQDTTNTVAKPAVPTISELSTAYQSLQKSKMLSDNIVMNSVEFKPLFGSKASVNLQASINVVRIPGVVASTSEIKSSVITAINSYFDIANWDFNDTFYFSELSAYLHDRLGDIIGSVVLVPNTAFGKFGDLYEIRSRPNEIFVSAATVDDVKVIDSLTYSELNGVS